MAMIHEALAFAILGVATGIQLSTIQPTASSLRHIAPQVANMSSDQKMVATASWDELWKKVTQSKPLSDKFSDHHYQTMYSLMLQQWHGSEVGPKFLEIGLGCDMTYGPGASVAAWQTLLPNVDLWEAEYNEACVEQSIKTGNFPESVKAVTGDQGNPDVVASWAEKSGGNFDIVVDDGGHKNTQIKTSFDVLWPHVKKGGLYFIEDLQVGRNKAYDDTKGGAVMSDLIQSWVDQLLIANDPVKHPLPEHVDYILCQREACVIAKSK